MPMEGNDMNGSSFIRIGLYLGVIVLLFLMAISFNSLRMVSFNEAKTARVAEDRLKLDVLETQIKEVLSNNSSDRPFTNKKVQEIDDLLSGFEQQLEGQKLPELEVVRKTWDELKVRSSPDPSGMIHVLDLLHKTINKNVLATIAKRNTAMEKDISNLGIMKIVVGILIFTMVVAAMSLDTLLAKERNELLKRLREFEKKSRAAGQDSISTETLQNLSGIIGHEGMTKIVQSFLTELPKAEESINKLLLQENLDEIHKIGHHSKSSSQTVGAEGLADLFNKLEQTDTIETAIELKTKINQEAKNVVSKLQNQLSHSA